MTTDIQIKPHTITFNCKRLIKKILLPHLLRI